MAIEYPNKKVSHRMFAATFHIQYAISSLMLSPSILTGLDRRETSTF